MKFKMYNGDTKEGRDGGNTLVDTAAECFAIFDRCVAEGRFPGDHNAFQSHTQTHGVLLEVTLECTGMGPVTIHSVRDGYLFIGGCADYIVGFVRNYDAVPGSHTEPARGVAYIGG